MDLGAQHLVEPERGVRADGTQPDLATAPQRRVIAWRCRKRRAGELLGSTSSAVAAGFDWPRWSAEGAPNRPPTRLAMSAQVSSAISRECSK